MYIVSYEPRGESAKARLVGMLDVAIDGVKTVVVLCFKVISGSNYMTATENSPQQLADRESVWRWNAKSARILLR